MATAGDGRGHGHAHIHNGYEHGHLRRVRRQYSHVHSGNGYGHGLPRGGGGRRTGVRGRRKNRRKERDIPGTGVGGASRGARADTARSRGSCGAGVDAEEAAKASEVSVGAKVPSAIITL